MSLLPCAHIRKSYIEKSPRSANLATRDVHGSPHWNLSFNFFFPLLRPGAERRRGGGREGWAGSIHSPEENTRSHFQAGSRLGAQRTPGNRGEGARSHFPQPLPAPRRRAQWSPARARPFIRGCPSSLLSSEHRRSEAPSGKEWMNQKAKPHAAPSTGAQLRGELSRGGGQGWRVDGRPPDSRRAANPASGAGERGSQPRKSRCSSAPTPAPRLSRSASPPHAASQSPGPAAASSHFHHRPAPPASSSRSAEQRRPGGPKPAAACASARRSQSGGHRFPGQCSQREASAAVERAAGGGGGGRGERGAVRSLPLLAGGGARQLQPPRRDREPGVGVLTGPKGPAGPCGQQAGGGGSREGGGEAGGQGPSRPSWGARPAGRFGCPSFFPSPPSPSGQRRAGCALCSSAGSWPRSRPPEPPLCPTPGARAVSPSSPQEDL